MFPDGSWFLLTICAAVAFGSGLSYLFLRSRTQRLDKKRQEEVAQHLAEVRQLRAGVIQDRAEAQELRAAAAAELARVAQLDYDSARAELQSHLRQAAERDGAAYVHQVAAKAKQDAKVKARAIIAATLARLAGATSAEQVVTRVTLPSAEMKGRIIGKEGRNIRTFEAVSGVNLIVDDNPLVVMVSSFDAERRECAVLTLESLIADGRIHPARIEATWEKVTAAACQRHDTAGHEAARRAGVNNLHPDLINTLGRLRLRTSYGQNVLEHLVESAQIAALLAAELGADCELAQRAAFLHDIGKGSPVSTIPHAQVGAKLARRCGENEAVVNAIAAHHNDLEPQTVEAVLVQAADAISASRPGARREELDSYIERLERLEEIVCQLPGVAKVAAFSAGREVRVIVDPQQVYDGDLAQLATAIARDIEQELSFPGEIIVTVIRQTRAGAVAS